jgi:hypothetical protein
MNKLPQFFTLIFVLLYVGSGLAIAQKRIALVVGNSNYEHTSPLANPANDAALMALTLEKSGFSVTTIIDADYRKFKRSMLEFGRKLRGDDIEAGLFYYAGHGIQVRGENYLVPISAKITSEDEVDLEAININSFLQVMNSSDSKVNIVVLDACRNNPFARSFRSVSRGLAPVQAPKGTYIAYATAPGDVALDGEGKNSPYTLALAKSMLKPGVPIERVFKSARVSVLAATNEKQVPWEVSSITGEFFFNASNTLVSQEPLQPRQVVTLSPQDEVRHSRAPTMSVCSRRYFDVGISEAQICVSSELDSQSGNSYTLKNMFDDKLNTAWVEGIEGQGYGEQILVKFDNPTMVSNISVVNGYNKSQSIFSKNSRVRRFNVKASTGNSFNLRLEDKTGWQSFKLNKPEKIEWLELTIDNVHEGTKYQDTAISEFRLQ